MPDSVFCPKCNEDLYKLNQVFMNWSRDRGIAFECRECGTTNLVERYEEKKAVMLE